MKRLALSIAATAAAFAVHAAAPKTTPQGTEMDYGPFLDYSVLAPGAADRVNKKHENGDPTPVWKAEDLLATKGVVVKLPADAAVCFDTDTCRYAGAWTGGWLDITKCNLTHVQGPLPVIGKGTLVYASADAPGWAKGDSFTDPRPKSSDPRVAGGEGPLPKDWAHYKGLYRDGDKVVFSYTVGGVEVLDMPGSVTVAGKTTLTRTVRIERSATAMKLRVVGFPATSPPTKDSTLVPVPSELAGRASALSHDGSVITVGLVGSIPPGVQMSSGESSIDVTVPASQSPIQFSLAFITNKDGNSGTAFKGLLGLRIQGDNPADHTKGGPPRWPREIEGSGVVAKDTAPYVVDAAPLPSENPWKSWIKPGGFDFFPDGRCALCTMNGDVWVSTPLVGDLAKVKWKRFAAGLYEPLGLRIVDSKIYVLGRDQISILHDLNGGGEADFYENFNNDAVSDANYHSFHYELQTDKEGNFYYAVTGNQMALAKPDSACVIKVSKYGDTMEVVSTGLRAANGMGAGPDGEITVADNQGHWTPASPIYFVKPNAFFGYHGDPRRVSKDEFAADVQKRPHDAPPLCWVPYKWDNSSGGQVWAPQKFGPLSGHMLHLSYGMSAVFEVVSEQVNGVWQGGVVPLGLKFDSGIMRGRVNPADNTVWVCGLKGWQTNAGKDGCLQRIRYTGKPFTLPTAVHVTPGTLRLDFDVALDPESAKDPGAYSMEAWTFHRTENYGSDDFKVSDPKTKGRDALEIKSVELLPTKRSVLIKVEGLRAVPEYVLTAHVNAADGTPIKVQVGGTINTEGAPF